jgi:hypothetical protein
MRLPTDSMNLFMSGAEENSNGLFLMIEEIYFPYPASEA